MASFKNLGSEWSVSLQKTDHLKDENVGKFPRTNRIYIIVGILLALLVITAVVAVKAIYSTKANGDTGLYKLNEICQSMIASFGDSLASGCQKPAALYHGTWFCAQEGSTCHAVCQPGYNLSPGQNQKPFVECRGNFWCGAEVESFRCIKDNLYSPPSPVYAVKSINTGSESLGLNESCKSSTASSSDILPSGCQKPVNFDHGLWFCTQEGSTCFAVCHPGYKLALGHNEKPFLECFQRAWAQYKTFQCVKDKQYSTASPVNSSVSCGGHMAEDCSKCVPPGKGFGYCNGVCTWSKNKCIPAPHTGPSFKVWGSGRITQYVIYGTRLGIYEKTGTNLNGFAVYRLVGSHRSYLHVSSGGRWVITSNRDSSGIKIRHIQTSPTPQKPPFYGWEYWDSGRGAWIKDSNLRVGNLSV